ncbi:MAG: ABC transporter permease [Patescibacteria group bacterium]|jgi:putative ABC transport system permease protein
MRLYSFIDQLKTTVATLRANKGRSILTLLGIVIGITSVIIVFSAGRALQAFMDDQMSSFGSNYIQIEPRTPGQQNQGTGPNVVTTLKESDREAIMKIPNIRTAYGGLMGQEKITYQSESEKVMLWGVSPEYLDIDTGEIAAGRWFTQEENNSQAKVAVLGSEIKDTLFGTGEYIGRDVKIGRQNFKVIGSFQSRGGLGFFNMDKMVWLPVKTLQKEILGVDYLSWITAQMADPTESEFTAVQVNDLLRDRHNITDPARDDFQAVTQEQAQGIVDTVVNGITALLLVLVAISLLVGGVGIMNIMYVTVTERTYEIGLRKAVGATARDILWQFLLEAVTLTFAGGVVGIVCGALVSFGISLLANFFGFAWKFSLPLNGILISCIFSVLVGLIFGLYPARKAARLDPVEALRNE